LLIHDLHTDELMTACFHGPGAESYRGVRIPADQGVVGLAFKSHETVFVPDVINERRWFDLDRVQRSGLRSVFTVPLIVDGQGIGVLGIDSPMFSSNSPPGAADVARLKGIGSVVAAALRNARQVEQLKADRERIRRMADERRQLRTQVGHLREQMREAHWPNTLIGESRAFQHIRDQIEVVAPADTSVLIVGETGTGKELVARAIHDQSRRGGRPFVAINCAALPESLVESELFGYEKGAFTGALGRKAGKFEVAHLGTVFLDEIGDLPAQAQAKLLRVLQEREVQRIGGAKPFPVDVRVIAATNQDLEQCMNTGRFRADLFYRLSVFPIRLVPLRERSEDIPSLVSYFAGKFAAQQHKPVPDPSRAVIDRLLAYDWPGNIRELQNVIERAVILTRGTVMDVSAITIGTHLVASSRPSPGKRHASSADAMPSAHNVVAFADAERTAILQALELTGWRVSGRGGAAEMLDLKPTTLHAKMKKLGIRRPSVAAEVAVPAGM
jgi:formate hydrogenlyase transcriptional activator